MAEPQGQRLHACLQALQPEMVDLLERLVRAESPSGDVEAQRGPYRILAEALSAAGYTARRIRGFETGDHLYARPADRRPAAPRQLLVGHMDTVWPVGTLERMPVRRRGGLLFGPGTADMKGGLVVLVFALKALRELSLHPAVTPVVLVNADEEIGSVDSTRFVRLLAEGAERAFVLECGEGAEGRLKIARKGLGRFVLTVRGRSSHAGAAPEEGVSAILELSHLVQRLFALNDPAGGVTVNVGTIDGGYGANVVAAEARAVVDVRAPTTQAARALEAALRRLEPMLPGASIEVTGGWRRPPMEPGPGNRALLAAAERLGREVGLSIADAGLVGGGSDANTTSLFTPTLDGLGPIGDGSHAIDEHVDVELMPARAALLSLLLLEPAGPEAPGGARLASSEPARDDAVHVG